MDCPEYYVTRCEKEIFSSYTNEIIQTLTKEFQSFDLIELGAGDATKTKYLLLELVKLNLDLQYVLIDISGSIIEYLQTELPAEIPGLHLAGLTQTFM